MRKSIRGAVLLALLGVPLLAAAQPPRPTPEGSVDSAAFSTRYIRLGLRNAEALLYQPAQPDARARIALVYAHPSGHVFNEPPGAQMATRGHPVMMVNYHGAGDPDDAYAPAISQAIRYLRTLPGVERIVLVGHSGGGHLVALYQNMAENGPSACNGPEKLYPCDAKRASGLERPDGLILLDPTLGAFHQASSIDPAGGKRPRPVATDMFAPANGYYLATRSARYADSFIRRFHAAQRVRNGQIVDQALARLAAIDKGSGAFSDDEPFVIPGMGVTSAGARLYQPDTRLLSRTRGAWPLLKADGSVQLGPILSIRPATGQQTIEAIGTLEQMTQNTTVRRFLGNAAIRIGSDFAITADDIVGVDWRSAISSTPANAEGISVPTLVLAMGCHYLVVPDEIIFNHLKARDKTFAVVEGATHVFTPCKAEYGDTVKRSFDAVSEWLGKDGRF